jgi:hypothetical protein
MKNLEEETEFARSNEKNNFLMRINAASGDPLANKV